jgi:5-methylcytosine-specific restriction endonuclease McrA
MSKRAKVWAVKARARLMDAHGNECALCGDTFNLQFDCIIPQGNAHHRFSTDKRMTFYRRQDADGNLQLLCGPCHTAKSENEDRRKNRAVIRAELFGHIIYANEHVKPAPTPEEQPF